MIRWLIAWGPAAIWAAFLFLVSARSTLPVDLDSGLDKVAHFGAYLVLGFLAGHAANRTSLSPLVAILLGWTYGLLDELHQSAVPGRDASAGDWLADAAGTVIGVLLFLLLWSPRARASADLAGTEPTRR